MNKMYYDKIVKNLNIKFDNTKHELLKYYYLIKDYKNLLILNDLYYYENENKSIVEYLTKNKITVDYNNMNLICNIIIYEYNSKIDNNILNINSELHEKVNYIQNILIHELNINDSDLITLFSRLHNDVIFNENYIMYEINNKK